MLRLRTTRVKFLIALLLVSIGVTWQTARPAQALFGIGDQSFTSTVVDIPRSVFQAVDKAIQAAKSKAKVATDIAFKNGVRTFLSTVVQQFATSLATTAPGQKPLFLTNPTTFFSDVENAAAGQFIDDFTRGLTGASFNQRGQLVGGTTGPAGASTSAQGRFIISRILRAGSNATGQQCQDNCQINYAVLSQTTPVADVTSVKSLADVPGSNDHDRAVYLLNSQLAFEIRDNSKNNPGATVVCRNIAPLVTSGNNEIWVFSFGVGSGSDLPGFSTMSYKDCYNRVVQAINNEQHDAGEDVKQCLLQCKTGIGGTIRSQITNATATDVFAAAENFDIRQSPAVIASSLSKDGSDFGQLLQASALLTATVQDKVLGEQTKLNAGTLPRTSKVSDQVLTPKEATSALFGVPFYNNNGELTYTGTGFADVLKGIASFINSPVGKALTVYFRSRCGLNADACKGPSNPQSEIGRLLFGSSAQTGVAAAKIQLASLGQTDIVTGNPGKDQVDVVSQLVSGGLIDSRFGQAIDETLTLREALDRGLIDGSKTFGFDASGLQPQDGYTFRALQYLRKYRVTPVGWELAAKYSQQFSAQNLTLNYLVSQYNICAQDTSSKVCSVSLQACSSDTDCKTGEQNGGTCGASPYCGLVDPDWVLKAPQTFCRRQGAGEDILSKEFVCDQNNVNKVTGEVIRNGETPAEDTSAPNCVYDSIYNAHPDLGHWVISRDTNTCADTQSCIAEKADGTCLAYGYCIQEKDTIKFAGTQCDAQNATCTTYTNTAGQNVSYLANTVDTTTCSPGSEGCQWYCQQPSFDQATNTWTCSETAGSKIYLTSKAATCNAGDAGCTQFIKVAPGTNMLANSGFETYEGGLVNGAPAPAAFTAWNSGAIAMTPIAATDTENSSNNTIAVGVATSSTTEDITQTVNFGSSLEEKIITGTVRMKADAVCTARVQLCVGASCTNSPLQPSADATVGTSWGTAGVQIAIPTAAELPLSDSRITFRIIPNTSSDATACGRNGLMIDSAQVTEAAGISNYTAYGEANVISLNGKRQSCSMADVGCEAYTPSTGGSVVNAIVTPSNRCSASSVGCQMYQRKPITSLPYRDFNPAQPTVAGPDVTIVAQKGQQCTAADVGCEEYTNLDTVKSGGEGKEYFASVKQCVRPSMTGVAKATYYTWMGDAQRGLQLHSVTLVKSNVYEGPCVQLGVGTSQSDPTCADTAQTLSVALCSAAEMATNDDCKQYYDSELHVYYIRASKTVSVTDDCHPYRNTIDQTDPQYVANKDNIYFLARSENRTCTARAASCRAYSGTTGAAARTLISETFERSSTWIGGSRTTASTQAGGHSLQISVAGSNNQGVAFTPVTTLKNAGLKKGKTYILKFTAAAAQSGSPVIRAFFGTGNDTTGVFSETPGMAFQTGTGVVAKWNDAITPSGPEWQQYSLGPITITQDPAADLRLGIVAEGGAVYIDSVKLIEANDVQYLINNSAPSCPATDIGCAAYTDRSNTTVNVTSFSRLCNQQVVGCVAAIDTKNSASPFEQTTKGVTTPADTLTAVVDNPGLYCSASAKGCQMLGQPQYVQDTTLKSMKTVYKIVNPDRFDSDLCLANENSCQLFTDGNGSSIVMKDPGTSTCTFVQTKTGAGTWYITGTTIPCATRAPENLQPVGASCSPVCVGGSRNGKACGVPSTNASVNATQCPGGGVCTGDLSTAGRISSGTGTTIGSCTSNAQCTGGNACVYQVGVCPQTQNSCTTFRDPSNPTSCQSNCTLQLQGGSPIYVDASCTKTVCKSQTGSAGLYEGQNCQTSQQCGTGSICVGANTSIPTIGAPGCQAYSYLKNSLQDDANTCDGIVDPKQGCLPFNDTSKNALNFRGI